MKTNEFTPQFLSPLKEGVSRTTYELVAELNKRRLKKKKARLSILLTQTNFDVKELGGQVFINGTEYQD